MTKKTLYSFIISFVLLITVVVLNRLTFDSIRNNYFWVDHTREVINTFQHISDYIKSAEIYSDKYGDSIGRQYFTLYKKQAGNVKAEIRLLRSLVADNAAQVQIADSISSLYSNHEFKLKSANINQIIEQGESWRLQDLYKIHTLINKGIDNEEELLNSRKNELTDSIHQTNFWTTILSVIAMAIIITIFIFNFFISKRQKWLEGFLESVINTSQNVIVYYKAIRINGVITDFKIEFANNAINQLMKINPGDIIGKNLTDLQSHIISSNYIEKFAQVIETGQPFEFDTLYQTDHVEKWFYVSLAKMQEGVTATFHDITPLKAYQEELKHNIEQLERSNTDLEQYAYAASHDLQEPLRKIRSFGSYLQDTQASKMDTKGQQQLGKIMTSAERMSVLIKDILSYSSLKNDESFESTDLNKIVEGVLLDLDLAITQKKARITIGRLPVIEAIPLQMTQLFYNLISNSLKFSKEDDKPEIKITSRLLNDVEKEENDLVIGLRYYHIEVSDNGIGFSHEYQEQIFGLFKRLNDKQFYPGSGIGLALCKKVVDNHNGIITASGKEQEGASFVIILPEKREKLLLSAR